MKAAVLEELGRIVVKEIDDPQIDDDSALLKVESVSVCGSDIRIFHHGNPRLKLPAVIGHETAGVIVKAGKNVTRVKEGQRVAVGADVPCGLCKWCREGLGNRTFETWMREAGDPDDLLCRIQREFVLGGHKAAAIAAVEKRASVYLVSDLPDQTVRCCGMTPYARIMDALHDALQEAGTAASLIVLPQGGSLLPVAP